MAGTIKGISVLISGDTVDLKKSLGDVEKTSKSLQSELNQVNKQLKFDPQNTVLLTQKQEILEEKIANTKLTLEKLESVREQVEEQAQKGDLGVDKFRAYQREVEATKGILHNLEKQLQDTQAAQNDLEKASENVDFSKFEKEIDNVKQSVSGLKDTLKGVAGDVGKGFVAAGGAAAAAIKSYDSVESALNSIQAQTGASESEMMKFKSTLENVYSGNYGENMQDIANVMSAVVQFTGEMDAGKVQSITESVFALSDSFQYDYAESLRAMNMLIKQFGLSSDEAFNLIVQGSQKGLNKNGDLLDSINEYAVHYKQLGYSAEEFFNSLENGTVAGTFSVDKLGDAMKEFGIKSKDTATTTTEGFQLIGLDADKMREAFAKGGNTAKEATDKTLTALFSLKDEVKQNQAGVDLFGTMWEDLGIEGVKALMDVSGEADKTKNSMEKIKGIKYDDLGNRISTLGRRMQTEVINPAIEDFYPEAEKFIDWAADNIDSLIPLLKMVGKQVAIIWGYKKAREVVSGIKKTIDAYKALKTATDTAKVAQEGLNLAQKANLIGLVITGAMTLCNVLGGLAEANREADRTTKELNQAHEELSEKLDDTKSSYDDFTSSRNESVSNTQSEFQYYNDLWNELDGIVDQNGKVKKGYEDRAKFITNELQKATGKEIEWNGNVIKSYKDLKASIKDLLVFKQSEATLSSYESSYTEAKGAINGKSDINGSRAAYFEAQKQYIEAQNFLDSYQNELRIAKENNKSTDELEKKYKKYTSTDEDGVSYINKLKENFQTQEKLYFEYLNTIQRYEDLQTAVLNNNVDNQKNAMLNIQYNLQTFANSTNAMLKKQVEELQINYDNLKEAVKSGAPGATQVMLEEAEKMLEKGKEELKKGIESGREDVKTEFEKGEEVFKQQLKENNGDFEKTIRNNLISTQNNIANPLAPNIGIAITEGIKEGIEKNQDRALGAVANFGLNVIGAIKKTLGINSPSREAKKLGKFFTEGLNIGISENAGKVNKTVTELSESMLKSLDTKKINDALNSVNSLRLTASSDSSSTGSVKKIINSPNISVNINGAQVRSDSDIDAIANKVSEKLGNMITNKGMEWG